MTELSLVAEIRRLAGEPGPGVVVGIGDDAAVYRPRAGEDLVFTSDMLIEGVHFERGTHGAEAVGRKAVARAVSDVAAMGAAPRFCLLSVALAPWCDRRWFRGFVRGVVGEGSALGAGLVGGDLSHAGQVACDVVVCGAVRRGKALRRDGARAGDFLYVSGRLGGAALGLRTRRGAAWRRQVRPEPRVELGQWLASGVASAAMDLSDGLSLDLKRLCEASAVAAELDRLPPVFRGATVDDALHGGEDYELLFTVRPGTAAPAEWNGLALTRIGRVVAGEAGRVRLKGEALPALGYQHF